MKRIIPVFLLLAGFALFFTLQAQNVSNTVASEEVVELPVDPKKKTCSKAEKAACSKDKTAEAATIVAGAKDVDGKKTCTKAEMAKCSKAEKAACSKATTAEAATMVAGAKDVDGKKVCTKAEKAACSKAATAEATSMVAGAKDVEGAAKEKATCTGYKVKEAKMENDQ
ncbi:MAG: hypothetical protein KTR13_08905 [Saprospiraceae bacterium]|nr:hypothetical protein [Saprospiraceae bacterium]